MATEVQKDLYGVGFSPLSIKNKKYAEPEELLADKEAGLLAIYQADGSVISAEYLSRIKRHLKEFTQRCIDDSTVGYIYRVNVTDALVKSIKKTENLFVNTLEFDNGKNPYQFIRLSMDSDLFNKHEYIPLDLNNVKVKVNFTLTADEESHSYEFEEKVSEVNNKAYGIDYDEFDFLETDEISKFTMTINSITIIVPDNFNTSQFGFNIHDILIAFR
jgi:hypothetical protein